MPADPHQIQQQQEGELERLIQTGQIAIASHFHRRDPISLLSHLGG